MVRWEGGESRRLQDEVVVEAAITLHYNQRELVTLLATPRHLDELALGYVLGEGLAHRRDHLSLTRVDAEQGRVSVSGPASFSEREKRGPVLVTTGGGRSSCSREETGLSPGFPLEPGGAVLEPQDLLQAVRVFHRASQLFRRTGGVHGAALVAGAKLLCFRADIGRHNAVDKVGGYCYLQGISTDHMYLLLSGRISSEIVLKAGRMGLATVVSPAAPTNRAVELASGLGMTLVGFARSQRFNVYSGEGRIRFPGFRN